MHLEVLDFAQETAAGDHVRLAITTRVEVISIPEFIGKTFAATVSNIYYPYYRCVTVACIHYDYLPCTYAIGEEL